MASSEIEHKKRLVALANVILGKYNAVKRGEEKYKLKMERKFQPLLNKAQPTSSPTLIPPLAKKEEKENVRLEEPKSELSDSISEYDEALEDDQALEDSIVSEDATFGLNRKKDGYYLGKVPVQVKKNVITIHDED